MATKKAVVAETQSEGLGSYFNGLLKEKRYADDHYNFQKENTWESPTGSLNLDDFLKLPESVNGGIRPGIWRISGEAESGKTSFSLNCARLFQESQKGFVLYINAEGRLNDALLERSGINTDPDYFQRLDCNILETVLGIMIDILDENKRSDSPRKIFFILDSIDALISKEDSAKSLDDGVKVASTAGVMSRVLKNFGLAINKLGHSLFLLNQTRMKMSVGHAGAGGGTIASGGKAIEFFANNICEVEKLWTDLYIWENPNAGSVKEKGKRIGHYFRLKFTKTQNEKSGRVVSIPIKYGALGGQSIWRSIELTDLAQAYGLLKKSGAWYEFDKSFADKFPTMQTKHQGFVKLVEYLDANTEIVDQALEYFRAVVLKAVN